MKKTLLIFISIFIIACGKDLENIIIDGIVYDKYTHRPIKNKIIKIKIECWKYANSPDESYAEHEIKYIEIDSNGNYSVSFNKGAFVTFDVVTNGYSRYVNKLYITNNDVSHDIELIPFR